MFHYQGKVITLLLLFNVHAYREQEDHALGQGCGSNTAFMQLVKSSNLLILLWQMHTCRFTSTRKGEAEKLLTFAYPKSQMDFE